MNNKDAAITSMHYMKAATTGTVSKRKKYGERPVVQRQGARIK